MLSLLNGCSEAAQLVSQVSNTPTPKLQYSIQVQANQQWTDTGVDIDAGDQVVINAGGFIKIAGSDPGKNPDGTGPDGSVSAAAWAGAVAPGLLGSSLIGRIASDSPFEVGSVFSWYASSTGRLYLGVNDNASMFGDNSGFWSVEITITKKDESVYAGTISIADLQITATNLGILNDFDKLPQAYDTTSTGAAYRKLLWDYGKSLDVAHKQFVGQYTQLDDNAGSGLWGECVSAVKALSKSNVYAGGNSWVRGKKVMDGGVKAGTVIATFTANNGSQFDPGGNSHTAIFKDYVNNGFEVWDQNWMSQRVFGTHVIYNSGSGTSNAVNYYVVEVSR
jgi:hypothetical protein